MPGDRNYRELRKLAGDVGLPGALNLLGPSSSRDSKGAVVSGPDLLRPRPRLRIVPGKMSGEPHLRDSRVTTLAVAAHSRRGYSDEQLGALYADQDVEALREAVELEASLAPAA